MIWEGAELCFYIDGESHAVGLSDTQFAIVAKILGLQYDTQSVSYYSDSTLQQFAKMEGNPLKLKKMEE